MSAYRRNKTEIQRLEDSDRWFQHKLTPNLTEYFDRRGVPRNAFKLAPSWQPMWPIYHERHMRNVMRTKRFPREREQILAARKLNLETRKIA